METIKQFRLENCNRSTENSSNKEATISVVLLKWMLVLLVIFGGKSFAQDWTRIGDMPFPHGENGNAVIDGKLYILGSFWQTNPDSRINRFDPATGSWTKVGDLPSQNTNNNHFTAGASVWNGEIYMCGGKNVGTTTGHNRLYIYNPVDNTWRRGPDLPEVHWAGPSVVLNNKLYVLTGAQGQNVTSNHHYVLDLNNQSAGWTTLENVPEPRVHAAAVALDGYIYLIGGEFHHSHDGNTTTVQRYDPSNNSWVARASMPVERSHHEWSTFVYNGKILSVGGRGNGNAGKAQSEIIEYDAAGDNWIVKLHLPFDVTSTQAKVINDILYVCGGGKGDWWSGSGKEVWTYPLSGVLAVEDQRINPVLLYPNPTSGNITLEIPLTEIGWAYQITSLTGQVLKLGTINASTNNLNLKELDNGIYFLQLSSRDKKRETIKIIKQ